MPFLLVPTHCIFTLCSRFFRVWLSLFTTSPAPRQPRCAPQLVGAALVLFAIAWLPGARGADLILSWTDNSNNEEGFQIDRSVAGGPFVTIARTGPNVVTYTDKTLLPATFYSYRLRAYKGALASAFTTVVSATTAAALPSSNGPVSSNTPPTVTAISSRSLTVGAVTAAIPFTIGDSTTATTALVVSATSSNPAVLPQASLVLGGTGANRTLTLRPPSAVGSTVITVSVSDGALSATQTFTVSVAAPNTPPTISAITSRSIALGAVTAAIPFTIGDSSTAATALIVRATSSNLAVLPQASLVLGGSGANRTLTLRPPSAVGSTVITVSVSDGALTATRSFTVSVASANTPPTITAITSRSITMGAVTAAIPFTIGDSTTAATALVVRVTSSNLAVLPAASVVIGGSGTNRTLTLAPPSAVGSTVITISVFDGALTATRAFTVTVVAPNTPPTVGAITDQSVEVGTVSLPIPVTVSDTTTLASALSVSVASSNVAVLPLSALTLGGSGGNRTLTVNQPAVVGSSVVTISVSDGSLTATRSFTVTVIPFDPPPTLTGLEDLSTSTNGLVLQRFSVGDPTLPATAGNNQTSNQTPLIVTAVSSNAALLPSSSITLSGTSTARTLSGSLVPGATGTTMVTVSVSNGRKITRGSFNLTVVAPNTAPWISNLVSETSRPAPFFGQPFTAGDVETSAESLLVTATSSNQALVPDSGIRLSSNGIDHAILLLPVRDQTGTTTISVRVTDGVLTTTKTFNLTVTP